GFLERTLRGRKLTAKAYEHLGLPYARPVPAQKKLFKD
ncbi:MAG: Holliday junction branch migration DNA helicase RuvB, partial [Candidatus Aminicenantes bacterium]|nr:Holliday junction branch migration DNA helicase RuvB [Candidatus Aminicenantes bacterium]